MHDDFEPIGAIVERLVNGVAPAPRESETGATALAGTGVTRRAHHDARGGAGIVIWVDFSVKGTGAAGPTSPPRQDFRNRTQGHPPATGGLGNARRAKT